MSLLEPLAREHSELRPQLELLRVVADSVGEAPGTQLHALVEDALRLLQQRLLPHARAEDSVVYPLVERTLGAGTTATMSRELDELESMAEELEELHRSLLAAGGEQPLNDLRRVLYGLYALARVHVAEERLVYLPLLEAHLTPEEAQALVTAVHQAAQA